MSDSPLLIGSLIHLPDHHLGPHVSVAVRQVQHQAIELADNIGVSDVPLLVLSSVVGKANHFGSYNISSMGDIYRWSCVTCIIISIENVQSHPVSVLETVIVIIPGPELRVVSVIRLLHHNIVVSIETEAEMVQVAAN